MQETIRYFEMRYDSKLDKDFRFGIDNSRRPEVTVTEVTGKVALLKSEEKKEVVVEEIKEEAKKEEKHARIKPIKRTRVQSVSGRGASGGARNKASGRVQFKHRAKRIPKRSKK